MTEFRRAERMRQIQRKAIRICISACLLAVVVSQSYSFASAGASKMEDTLPLVEVPESVEAPGECFPTVINVETPMEGEEEEKKNGVERQVYLGEFEATGYCGCDLCCGKKDVKLTKMETVPKPGYTVAADPEVISLGSGIVINGVTYQVEDVGQAIKGNRIDIFFATHEEAIEFGRQKMSVYLKQSL